MFYTVHFLLLNRKPTPTYTSMPVAAGGVSKVTIPKQGNLDELYPETFGGVKKNLKKEAATVCVCVCVCVCGVHLRVRPGDQKLTFLLASMCRTTLSCGSRQVH